MKDIRDVISWLKSAGVDGAETAITVLETERTTLTRNEADARVARKELDTIKADYEALKATPQQPSSELAGLKSQLELMQKSLKEKDDAIKAKEAEDRKRTEMGKITEALTGVGINAKEAQLFTRAEYGQGVKVLDNGDFEFSGKLVKPSEFAEAVKSENPHWVAGTKGAGTQKSTTTPQSVDFSKLSAVEKLVMANSVE
jgi:hypothetical protein